MVIKVEPDELRANGVALWQSSFLHRLPALIGFVICGLERQGLPRKRADKRDTQVSSSISSCYKFIDVKSGQRRARLSPGYRRQQLKSEFVQIRIRDQP